MHNKLSSIELTYFVAACYTNVMTPKETILLTKSMVEHGEVLKIGKYPVVDKHCIGGIPWQQNDNGYCSDNAAAGFYIPKQAPVQ